MVTPTLTKRTDSSLAELWGILENSGTAGGVTDTFTDS